MINHETILGILNSDLTDSEKLEKIRELVLRVEKIERLALKYASEEGRKPNWEDRLTAIRRMEENADIEPICIDCDRLEALLVEGIEWLKRVIKENGAWKKKEDFKPFIVSEKPKNGVRPIEMLFVAPWEISIAIGTLYHWVERFQPHDEEAIDLIENGKSYLQAVQDQLGNGGLGDSIWLPGVRKGGNSSNTNTLETSMAIYAWGLPEPTLRYSQNVEKAVNYLKGNWNRKAKGWGFKKGWKPDVKSTSLALMVLAGPLRGAKIDEDSRLMLDESVEWILREQNPEDGSWANDRKGRDSAVYGSFYAIQALNMERYFLKVLQDRPGIENLEQYRQEIDLALSRALQWYEASQRYMKGKGYEGWGWGTQSDNTDVENTAGAIVVFLDAGWLEEGSPLLEKTLYWLLRQKDHHHFWGVNTALVLLAFERYLKPETRMFNMLKARIKRS